MPEETKKGYSNRMKEMIKRPDVVEKIQAHLHSDANPFRSPEVAARAQATLKEQGYKMLNGGNGRGQTVPQQMLLDALGPEWVAEFVCTTGRVCAPGFQKDYPHCYKLDLAHPRLKINVEVDGESHKAKAAKERDAKRDELLTSRGWLILRLQNKQIMTDLPTVLSIISKLAPETTSPQAC